MINIINDYLNGNTTIPVESIAVPIGGYVQIDGSVEPDITRFIKLTKDLTGVGLYNEGKLISQSTVVSGDQTFYTAIINDALSPKFGEVIKLVNSTIDNTSGLIAPTFISAGETSGLIRHNRFQGHYHGIYSGTGIDIAGGQLRTTIQGGGSSIGLLREDGGSGVSGIAVQGALTDATSGTPRTGTTTEPNNVTAIYYMRIR